MSLNKFESSEQFVKAGFELISLICKKEKTIKIALSGGSTPLPLYQYISKTKLPFEKIEFYIVDERFVPLNNQDSNYKMINENLIKPIGDKLKKFVFFNTSLSINECLSDYEKKLPDKFDLVILGMGNDGHIASLFPNSEALQEENKSTINSQTDNYAVWERLSISLPLILNSKKILLLLKGSDKKVALDVLLNSDKSPSEFPAKYLLNHPDFTIHYCTCSDNHPA